MDFKLDRDNEMAGAVAQDLRVRILENSISYHMGKYIESPLEKKSFPGTKDIIETAESFSRFVFRTKE